MINIRTDLILRVCIITAVFTVISSVLIFEHRAVQFVPSLFVVFGIVIVISILYDIERFHAIAAEPEQI